MNRITRRTALIWLSRTLALACTLLVAVPGVSYVIATVRRKKGDGVLVRRVARLADLTPGQPFEAAIMASWQDAWIVHPEQPVGRVWLIRRTDAATPPEKSQVDAFTSICPHMGCNISWVAGEKRFFCPCHKGVFALDGKPLEGSALGYQNPAPRPMDKLETKLVEVRENEVSTWWVEVTYQQFILGLTTQVAKS